MSNTSIQLKKSGQTGNIPPSLAYGEVALNYADGRLYYKTASNVISYITNQYSFETINVDGSLILATSPTDTLNFVSGNNISLITDSLNNKITIAATATSLDQVARDWANSAGFYANSSFDVANSASLYANGAFIKANSAYSSQNTTGVYANAAYTHANAAYNYANSISVGVTSSISNGTSNVSISTANGNITAAVNGSTVISITANGLTTTGVGTGDISGANNIYANTFIGANAALIAGINVVPYIQSAYDQANTDVTNISIGTGTYGNATIVPIITVAANGRITSISNTTISGGGGGGASGSYIYNGTSNVYFSGTDGNIIANVAGNTIVSITANGLVTSGVSGDISGANNISANSFITTGSGGNISGANNIYANTFIGANAALIAGINVVPFLQSAFGQANAAYGSQNTTGTYANSAFSVANSAATYANGSFTQANAAFTVANTDVTNVNITAGQYGNTTTVPVITVAANGRIVAVSNATISGGGGGGQASYIYDGTSNVYFTGTNGNIIANVAGNTIVSITANGITTSGVSGDITGANNISANSFITTGSGGNISGANNIYANTIIAANGVTIAGVNALSYIQSVFTTANSSYDSQNTTGTYANSAFAVANSAGSYANSAFTAANSASSYANSAFEVSNSAGSYANAAFTKANTAITTSGGTITGSLNVTANLVVSGNLVVLGTETVINTTTLELDDTLIYLGANNYSSDAVDIGIIAHYNDGANAHTGIFRDANLKEWIFFKGYTPEVQSNNLINIADPSFAYANVWSDTFKGNLIANTVTVSGNVTVSGITSLGSVSNVRITGGTNGYVLSTDGAGNLSWVVQSGGGGSGEDQYARDTANAAFIQANAAFATANTGGGGGGSGSSIIAVDTFTANGTQNSFTLSYSTSLNSVIVNIDGVLQLKSAYMVSGATLNLSEPPANNSVIEVTTLAGTNLGYYNRTYTGDNTSTSFAVTTGVSNSSLIVTENGVVQEPGVDYYISGANVVFTTAPSTGVKIGVRELASTAVANTNIGPAFDQANAAFNKANTAVTTGKAIAMAIVFGG